MLRRFDASDGFQDGHIALLNIGLDPASVDTLVFA